MLSIARNEQTGFAGLEALFKNYLAINLYERFYENDCQPRKPCVSGPGNNAGATNQGAPRSQRTRPRRRDDLSRYDAQRRDVGARWRDDLARCRGQRFEFQGPSRLARILLTGSLASKHSVINNLQ